MVGATADLRILDGFGHCAEPVAWHDEHSRTGYGAGTGIATDGMTSSKTLDGLLLVAVAFVLVKFHVTQLLATVFTYHPSASIQVPSIHIAPVPGTTPS